MSKWIRWCVALSFLAGGLGQAMGADSTLEKGDVNKIQKLIEKQARLESELRALHGQIAQLGKQHVTESVVTPPKMRLPVSPAAKFSSAGSTSDLLEVSPDVRQRIQQTIINYVNGVTVVTSPLLGLKSAWNPSDLLYAVPAMNQDLLLLEDRSSFEKRLNAIGSTLNNRPLLVLSGAFEVMTSYIDSFANTSVLDVNINTLELDVWAIVSAWASGFMTIDFDNTAPQTGSRVTNSRLYVQRGFLTLGNLNVTPWYTTMGQMYVPFGRYASAMLTTPLTVSTARTEARALLLGYRHDGLYAEAYGFKGERRSGGGRLIFQGGGNVGYQSSDLPIGSLDIGVGYITNLAASQGSQNNALFPGLALPSTQFAGLANTVNVNGFTGNNLKHNVPGGDIHMEFGRGLLSVITEFAGAINNFDAGDIMYNYHGASPKAMHLEADLNFKFGHIPLTVGAAYDQSWDALALNLPEQSFFAVISTSLFKDTVQGIEYRHDINYRQLPNNAVGGAGNGTIANNIPAPSANVGGSQDLVSLLFGVYF
ncbi:MAG: hypothetical protein A3F10_05460 [Coxiella sp. RIFCSPHIGHO2_12_FULL_42_15]|nr:MAG: hypothetical protein A3F10_05460 [Coxiella sp. RIFCSPHIGHO2_12_FULL_42_15]